MKKSVLDKVSFLPPGRAPPAPRSSPARARSAPPSRDRRPAPAAAKTGRGIIAGEGQDVVESLRSITPGRRFQPAAIEILAGQVDHDSRAAAGELPANQSGGSIGPPPGLSVIDIQPMRGSSSRPRAKAHDILRAVVAERSARGDDLSAVTEAAAAKHVTKGDAGVG